MSPVDVAFVKAVVIAIVTAGTGLGAYALRLRHRSQASAQLERDVRDQLEQETARRAELESRVVELEERADFAERRLVQGRPHLPVTTPV